MPGPGRYEVIEEEGGSGSRGKNNGGRVGGFGKNAPAYTFKGKA